jgi:hypothetical protein
MQKGAIIPGCPHRDSRGVNEFDFWCSLLQRNTRAFCPLRLPATPTGTSLPRRNGESSTKQTPTYSRSWAAVLEENWTSVIGGEKKQARPKGNKSRSRNGGFARLICSPNTARLISDWATSGPMMPAAACVFSPNTAHLRLQNSVKCSKDDID